MNQKSSKLFELNGFRELSSIQAKVLENINSKRDLIAIAPTGTGKTHAFLFAIFEKIRPDEESTQALILAPTRELAMQIFEFAKTMKEVDPALTIDLAIGGMDNSRLQRKLNKQPHIIISTPGKLLDVMSWNIVRLDTISLHIIDEMDMMLDYGFIPEVNEIASRLQDHTQFLLFSATLPQGMNAFVKKYLRHPLELRVDEKILKPRIQHVLIHRKHMSVSESVLDVLTAINPLLAIVFSNTKQEVAEIASYLRDYGLDCVEIHGDVTDRGRKQIISRIKSGNVRYIIATDLAARGIDLPEVSHVINARIPSHDLSFYTHRVGRTGRTGRDGMAISIVDDSDQNAISRLLKQNIQFTPMRVRNGTLVATRPFMNFERSSKRIDPEISKLVSRKKTKVKPGYKKRHKLMVEELMRKKRREIIKQDIKQQKKERAKNRQRTLKGD